VARYSEFLGRPVTVRYRVGEVLLSATGTFSADSGRSIFLEQHLEQRGTRNYFRWEIPYPYIYRIEEHADRNAAEIGSSPSGLRASHAGLLGREQASEAAFSPFPITNVTKPLD
jgi:hypothetical protein